jgi:DNA-binding HxlR family transcriptional regulator
MHSDPDQLLLTDQKTGDKAVTFDRPQAPGPAAQVRPQAAFGVLAAQRAVAALGDVWTLRILRTIFRGKRRYGDFVKEFGVSRAVLTDRLGKLVEQGVLTRDTGEGGHPQYRLSDQWPGPVVAVSGDVVVGDGLGHRQGSGHLGTRPAAPVRWGNRWLAAGEDPLVVRHLPCGELLDARWHCGHCGETLARETVRFG